MCVYICYWYVCVDVCASHSGPTARQVCVCVCILRFKHKMSIFHAYQGVLVGPIGVCFTANE